MARKHINIRAGFDLQGFSTSGQNLEREFKKTARKMQSIGKTLSMSLTAPIVGLAGLSVVNFDKQAKSIAQVEAGLKSTGGTVGKTSQELQKMAAELQKVSLFGDEEILQGVTAQLLTFTNITGAQFEKTQMAALNLATRLDGDLKSASIMLGKALNDPVANLSALSRAGIQFTTQQKELVKSLIESGKAAEAQDLILEELEKQYGGSAEAAAKAGMGGITQMKNAIMDITESFGAIVVDIIQPMVGKIKTLAERFDGLSGSKKRLIVVISGIAAAIGPVMVALGFMGSTLIPALIGGFGMLISPIGLVIAGVAALAAGLLLYGQNSKNAKDQTEKLSKSAEVLSSATDSANRSINDEKQILKDYFTELRNTNKGSKEREELINKINSTYGTTLKNLSNEKDFINQLDVAYEDLVKSMTKKIRFNAIEDALSELVSLEQSLSAAFDKTYELMVDAPSMDSYRQLQFQLMDITGKIQENEAAQKKLLGGSFFIDTVDLTGPGSSGGSADSSGSKSSGESEASAMEKLQSKLADIQFAGSQRIREIKHEVAMLSMTDEEQIALERLNFAQEQAENELNFQIAQLENKKVLSEDEKAQLANLQAEKAAIIEQYFAELAAMENEANANQLGIKEAALKKQNDLLQLENANAAATQDEYNKAEKEREENHLRALIDLRKQYGKEVTDLEIQLAEKKFEVQKGANSKAESLAADLGALITNQILALVNGAVDAMSEFIEGAFSGVEGQQQDFGKAFMTVLGKFMGDFGKAMVALGVAQSLTIEGIKNINPIALIAGGIALAAAGAAITGLSKRGLDSSAGGGVGSSGGGNVNPGVTNIDAEPIVMETRIEGNQLILVQNRSNSFRR